MNKPFVIVDTTERTSYPSEALEKLAGIPHTLETRPLTSPEALIEGCTDTDALLVAAAHVTAEVFDALPRLRTVVRYGVGLDRIDLGAARRHGVTVHNTRGFCTDEMADHTMALILALNRDLTGGAVRARKEPWGTDYPCLRRLSVLTLGLIGYGAIGRAVAHRARAFGLTVLAYDPQTDAPSGDETVHLTDFETVLRRSDILSVHCPLIPETRHLIANRELGLMKPTAVLINTARGGIVDEEALVQALQEGRLAGAGLDVLETEPPTPGHPLLSLDNVLVTPHSAWVSEEASRDLVVGAFEQLAAALRSLPAPQR